MPQQEDPRLPAVRCPDAGAALSCGPGCPVHKQGRQPAAARSPAPHTCDRSLQAVLPCPAGGPQITRGCLSSSANASMHVQASTKAKNVHSSNVPQPTHLDGWTALCVYLQSHCSRSRCSAQHRHCCCVALRGVQVQAHVEEGAGHPGELLGLDSAGSGWQLGAAHGQVQEKGPRKDAGAWLDDMPTPAMSGASRNACPAQPFSPSRAELLQAPSQEPATSRRSALHVAMVRGCAAACLLQQACSPQARGRDQRHCRRMALAAQS